ncbi:MAG: hypothetical protein AB9917_15070 [Negativicutes bacterium]
MLGYKCRFSLVYVDYAVAFLRDDDFVLQVRSMEWFRRLLRQTRRVIHPEFPSNYTYAGVATSKSA